MKRFKNILYYADHPDTQGGTLERAVALAKTNRARLTVMDVTAETEEAPEIERRFGIDLNAVLHEHRLEQLEALTAPHAGAEAAVDPIGHTGEGLNRFIMDLASSLAERENARLHVVHVWRLVGESMLRSWRGQIPGAKLGSLLKVTERRHRDGLNGLLNDYNMAADDENVHLLKGGAAQIIATNAKELNIDLIVMGTVGRTGVSGLLIGNTAEDVLQTTQASVLTVKPEKFVSPIALP